MSFHIGDTVRIGKTGKVDYVVAQEPTDVNDLGTYAVTVESMNTQRWQTVEASRLTLIASADTEPMNTPMVVEDAPQPVIEAQDVEDFDPRTDRRQSAYGLAILNALIRKGASDPRRFAHNSNPLKPIGSERVKVRKRVKLNRTRINALNAHYNTLIRENGYTVQAA